MKELTKKQLIHLLEPYPDNTVLVLRNEIEHNSIERGYGYKTIEGVYALPFEHIQHETKGCVLNLDGDVVKHEDIRIDGCQIVVID